MSRNDVNAQTVRDMAEARAHTSVSVEEIRDYLHHGKAQWKARERIVDILSKDPVFDKSQRNFLPRTERYERGLAMTNRVYDLQQIHGWSETETSTALATLDEALPIALHNLAFQPVFNLQGGKELVAKYGPAIASRAILGCYLQTELGHGTNVGRLETTATYIPSTREFEIHTPSLTATKWWIGALGKTATHGVVQAKLILPNGEDMGPHLFFVQLRSTESHKPLPGITVGDIGPKSLGGFASTDNGFARFNKVRIPKENMLSGFANVSDEGLYSQPPHAKLSYGGMLYIRSTMVTSGGWVLAHAVTSAVRYTTVRRQGEIGSDGLEKQVITYPSTYYRLLPILSRAYVFIKLGKVLTQAFDTMAERLREGDFFLLAEIHATTSGLKVLVTTQGIQDIETARRSMGGHGFSAFSGVGRAYSEYLPSATYEGDNFVLDQQVVRAALKSYKKVASSKTEPKLSSSTNYLRHLRQRHELPSESNWTDPAYTILILELRAALFVQELAEATAESAVDASANQRASKAITEAFVAAQIATMLQDVESGSLDATTKRTLRKLYVLYLLTTVESGLTDILSFGLVAKANHRDPTRSLRLGIKCLCEELLPEAIGLTDAFGFTDWELDSALGVHDGKVYEALWERAQQEPLNHSEVTAAYEKSIKPILDRGRRIVNASPTKAKL